jgi:integrase/recombinase XerD
MNHRPLGSLLLSKAIVGFINYKTAEGLSQRTIESYDCLLKKWLEYIGDRELANITAQEINRVYQLVAQRIHTPSL